VSQLKPETIQYIWQSYSLNNRNGPLSRAAAYAGRIGAASWHVTLSVCPTGQTEGDNDQIDANAFGYGRGERNNKSYKK